MASASIPKIVIKNLDANLNIAIRNAAREIGEKIYSAFGNSVTKFYASYSPNWYDRTYALLKQSYMGVGGKDVFYKKSGRYGYNCGLGVGAENYSGNPYEKDPHHGAYMTPDIVFPMAWDKGIHGFNTYTIRKVHADKTREYYWRLNRKYVPKNSKPINSIMRTAMKEIDNAEYIYEVLYNALDAVGTFIEIV